MSVLDQLGAGPNEYLDQLRARVVDVVGDDRLCGIWLFGSGALGDFAPDRSDLDVQAVSNEPLPAADREHLAAALSHEALPCPARGLEFVLYPREGLDDPAGPSFGLNLNSGARMERRVDLSPDRDERFWFVIDVAIGRERGHPLLGPTADEVFPALPARSAGRLPAPGSRLVRRQRHDRGGHGPRRLPDVGVGRRWTLALEGRERARGHAPGWSDPGAVEKAIRLRDGSPEAPLTELEVAAIVASCAPRTRRLTHAPVASRTSSSRTARGRFASRVAGGT